MGTDKTIIAVVVYICIRVILVGSTRTSKWSECACHWGAWKAWSDCTSTCGGGYRERERWVWWTVKAGRCTNATDCATGSEEYWETVSCNTQCYNGGTYISWNVYRGTCRCPPGKKDSCCEETVTCGPPSNIHHGWVVGNNYEYGQQVTYYCENGYNMTDLSERTRSCSAGGYWTGLTPTCLYARSCDSNPCQNSAQCINELGDYSCICANAGWTGKNCETDIQPPVLSGCPTNRTEFVRSTVTTQNWTVPTFSDPMGTPLTVTSNYNGDRFDFPWGDFVIQYVAVKPANGLTTVCSFTIKIRPHACPSLTPPNHGAIICNGWRKEYARLCLYSCMDAYIFPPGFSGFTWYNCAASGIWFPQTKLNECLPDVVAPANITSSQSLVSLSDCQNNIQVNLVKKHYVKELKRSQFNQLCVDYSSECLASNVDIIC